MEVIFIIYVAIKDMCHCQMHTEIFKCLENKLLETVRSGRYSNNEIQEYAEVSEKIMGIEARSQILSPIPNNRSGVFTLSCLLFVLKIKKEGSRC